MVEAIVTIFIFYKLTKHLQTDLDSTSRKDTELSLVTKVCCGQTVISVDYERFPPIFNNEGR